MIKQLSIFVENKPGRLAEITTALGDAGIDIRALSIADTTDFGILRLIVDRPEEAVEKLRAMELTVSLTDVLAVAIDDVPGAFAGVVKLLSDQGVVIEYMYAFLGRSDTGAFVILRIEDIQRAIQVLTDGGVRLLRGEQVYHM